MALQTVGIIAVRVLANMAADEVISLFVDAALSHEIEVAQIICEFVRREVPEISEKDCIRVTIIIYEDLIFIARWAVFLKFNQAVSRDLASAIVRRDAAAEGLAVIAENSTKIERLMSSLATLTENEILAWTVVINLIISNIQSQISRIGRANRIAELVVANAS